MPESREVVMKPSKLDLVKCDLEIYGNSYWYDGERLDPTKFSMFIDKKKPSLPSSAWDRWLGSTQGKKVRVTLINDEKKNIIYQVLTMENAPTLVDFDSEVIVLDYPRGETQVVRRQFIEHMNSYREKDDTKKKDG